MTALSTRRQNAEIMTSTAATQLLSADSVKSPVTPPPVLPAGTPMQVLSQTIQPQINLPQPPQLQWWEVTGVLPSIAAVITVIVTAGSLFWNTTRQIASNRESLEKTLKDSDKKAAEDRAHTASESKLDRAEATTRAKEDRDARLVLAKHEALLKARSEIYAEVLTDFQKVQALIGRLPRTPLDEPEDATDLAAMSTSVNKLWLWGEVESVYKVRELYSLVNEFFFAALPKAQIIKMIRSEILQFENSIKRCNLEIEELEQEKKELEALPPTLENFARQQHEATRISASQAEKINLRSRYATHLHKRSIQLTKRSKAYLDFVIERQSGLMDQINSVMAGARSDAGLGGNSPILEAQSHNMSRRARQAIDRMAEESSEDLP